MKKILILLMFTACLNSLIFSQYITEVIEYKPAPGQLINTDPWGKSSSANSIIGGINGTVSLGAFGGYLIFKFENAVENHPDNPFGIDFTIFGNPAVDWAEPAAVFVMKDNNENGLSDDTWYELAGSDHYFSTSVSNYEITYTNPGGESAVDIPWSDNLEEEGYVYANSFYTQNYYPFNSDFTDINENSYTLTGPMIKNAVDLTNLATLRSYKRAFGYADNQMRGSEPYTLPDNPYTNEKENSGGDGFDISWAIDSDGNYLDLDVIHFIKVQNCINANADYLGEISSEICGAVDVSPDNSVIGPEDIIVIKDLPQVIDTETYQLEIFVFTGGRIQTNKDIDLSITLTGASLDGDNVLTFTESGELYITASLVDDPTISTSVTSIVDLSSSKITYKEETQISIYPNPANRIITVKGLRKANVNIYSVSGKLMKYADINSEEQIIDISNLDKGVYILKINNADTQSTYKIIKN